MIVGGGPSGIATALSLVHHMPEARGRVVVLEKETYPREKYCAGGLGRRGERFLERLDAVPDIPSVEVDGVALTVAEGQSVVRLGRTIGRVVRRIELDHALAQIAARRGVRIVEDARAERVVHRSGGAVVESSRGTFEARVVVGADGVGSVVRKALGESGGELRAQVIELDTEVLDSDVDRGLLSFDASDRRFSGYYWDFPTIVDGRPLVCRGIYHLRVGDDDVDIRALFDEWLAKKGLDIRRYKNKRFAERGWVRTTRLSDGALMLVGEAAGIDPVTGEGIAQAIEYGWVAGAFLPRVLSCSVPLSDWTARVHASRLAFDLSVRTALVERCYGRGRPIIERFLISSPDPLVLGCQHFAREPYSPGAFARVAIKGAFALSRA